MKEVSNVSHIKSIMILPFNVVITVPIVLLSFFNLSRVSYKFLSWTFILIGVVLAILGITLIASTITLFSQKGKGTLAPWNPTQKLVVVGPYQYVRNPMISGVIFVLLSEALIFHSISILIWATVFFVVNHIYFILSEEPKLERKFGTEYTEYKQNVPRWIPKYKR